MRSILLLEARAGIEPARNGFADRRVTTSPSGRPLMILVFMRFAQRLIVVEEEVNARKAQTRVALQII